MLTQTEGCIYLADKREKTLTGFRTVTDILYLNDHILNGGAVYSNSLPKNTITVLIPYIGDVEVLFNESVSLYIEEHQAYILPENTTGYQIRNPYQEDAINFFEICLPAGFVTTYNHQVEVDIQHHSSQLLPITDNIRIGQYKGREEGTYILKNEKGRIFAFVISGAFEVQNRLLQPRDGLLLNQPKEIEFEALSNDAILVIAEFP